MVGIGMEVAVHVSKGWLDGVCEASGVGCSVNWTGAVRR